MNGRPWSIAELEFLRLTYGHLPVRRIAAELERSTNAVYTAARDQNIGIRRTRAGCRKRPWTTYDREFVRLTYSEIRTDTIAAHLQRTVNSVFGFAFTQGLRKSDRFYERTDSGRTDGQRGEASRFPKGHVPANKGKKGYDPGGRSHETRFKPGTRPQTWVPVGTVVADPDGYLKKKIRDDAPRGKSRFNWRYIHVMHWERYRGPVPRGHKIRFRNGDKTDIRIANLELVSNAENARRNNAKRWAYPNYLNQLRAAKARLTREINKRERTTP